VAALRVQACVPVASVPAPAVHAEAVPAAKSTRADGVSMVVGEQSESGSRRGQNGVTSRDYRLAHTVVPRVDPHARVRSSLVRAPCAWRSPTDSEYERWYRITVLRLSPRTRAMALYTGLNQTIQSALPSGATSSPSRMRDKTAAAACVRAAAAACCCCCLLLLLPAAAAAACCCCCCLLLLLLPAAAAAAACCCCCCCLLLLPAAAEKRWGTGVGRKQNLS
jgi:hypothetical protein